MKSFWLLLAVVMLPLRSQTPAMPVLVVQMEKVAAKVSPSLYGLMTEEINYSYDGGLYAELIRNRAFRDSEKEPVNWSLLQPAGGGSTIALDAKQPLNEHLPVSLRMDVVSPTERVGLANGGFWGIPVRPRTSYRASFYAKSADAFHGPLTVSIESNDGTTVFAKADIAGVSNEWKYYEVTLETSDVKTSKDNRFVVSTKQPGTLWFNLVSLFPPTYKGRMNGLRPDIMQMLVDMKPNFLRFPGGNYLEGDTIATRFQWKKTLGDLTQRPGHQGCWDYRSSDGMGLLEFLEWCEDMHAEPVLGIFAGYSLKGEVVWKPEDLKPFIDEALEEIEFVCGDPNSPWGKVRAACGHPEPFTLRFVEIGNEDNFDKSKSYPVRFAQFYDAIKAKYPKIQIIATADTRPSKDQTDVYPTLPLRVPDFIDEHFYRSAAQMQDDATHYDKKDRKGPKIFVGEWATREGEPTTNLNAALGDAAWMTGMERNSDLVQMSCYAPLFVNVSPGAMQWKSNLIGYDALNSYGSPSYYAQKMFNTFIGDVVLPIEARNIPTQTFQPPKRKDGTQPDAKQIPTLFYVATRDSVKGTIYLKIVNTSDQVQPVEMIFPGACGIKRDGLAVILTSQNRTDTNTLTHPKKVVPQTVSFHQAGAHYVQRFPPLSIMVMQLETGVNEKP